MSQHDVIIIGAGPGGLACAARLAHWGVRVLLLERSDHVGGKAITAERDGFRYELGPKLQVPMRGPAYAELFAELGISEKLRQIMLPSAAICYRRPGDDHYTVQVNEVDPEGVSDGSEMFALFQMSEAEQARAIEIMAEMVMLSRDQLDQLDDVSMQEYLDRIEGDIPSGLYNYLGMHANASLAEPIDRVAASEQIKIMQQLALQGGGGYYEGGFGRMFEDLAQAFVDRGGEIRHGVTVEQVDIVDGKVTGVTTSEGVFEAPIVVSDAGIQPTVLKLVGEKHFPADYVEYVRNLEPGWGWASIRYFLNERVLTQPMYMIYADETWYSTERYERLKKGDWDDDVIVFITVPSNFDPSMAPPGKQCLVTGSISSPDPDATEIEFIYQKIEETMAKVFPGFLDAVERKVCEGPREVSQHTRDRVVPGAGGECVGIGQIAGQCGTMKPDPVSPIPGLYYCGCDAGYEGMGTHQGGGSGMRVAAIVRDALATR